MKMIAFLALVIALGGIGAGIYGYQRTLTEAPAEAEGSVPLNYRKQIVTYLHAALLDRDSVRDAEISKFLPAQSSDGVVRICVAYNAKNPMGGYTGKAEYIAGFKDGILDRIGTMAVICDDRRFVPFKELNALGQK